MNAPLRTPFTVALCFGKQVLNAAWRLSAALFCVVALCAQFGHAQVFVPQNDQFKNQDARALFSTDVKSGVVPTKKGADIFDPSPRIPMKPRPVAKTPRVEPTPTPKPTEAKNTPEEKEPAPGTLEAKPNYGYPIESAVSAESITEKAGNDNAVMKALEESRKLQQRLGLVRQSGEAKDPKSAVNAIRKGVETQEKIKEQQQYQF